MKIKTEVDIEFLEGEDFEELSVNKIILDRIVSDITSRLYQKIGQQIQSKVEKRIYKRMDAEINKLVKARMKSKIRISEAWEAEETTMDKLFKHKIDLALSEKVDDSGRGGGYGNYTRFEYITGAVIEKKLVDLVKKMACDINREVDKIFGKQIKDQITENFAQNIMKNLDVSKMLIGGK